MTSPRDQLIEQIFNDFGTFRRLIATRPSPMTRLELPQSQMEVLFKVWHHPGVSIKELATMMQVTGSAATQTVEALVQSGSIERTTDKVDRRIVRLSLTPFGHGLIIKAKKLMLGHLREMMGTLSEADLSQFHDLLQKIMSAKVANN